MAGNTFGNIFRLTSFGESHGTAVGGVLDGCPAGLSIDTDFVQAELARRRPGQSAIVTQRQEGDQIEFLSGVYEGKSTGAPIAFLVRNNNARPKDYDHLKDTFRPSHADFTYQTKYGHRDHRGGGRSSARETIARVAAGAIAKLLLKQTGVTINAYVSAVGDVALIKNYKELDFSLTDSNVVRCPDAETAAKMETLIRSIRKEGDTIGGIVSCVASGMPVGLGEPVFDKLHAALGNAILGINAVKGFDYGSGFEAARMRGSVHNDRFVNSESGISTTTNHSGGVQGGISNGEDIYFRAAFKPVATLMQSQESVNAQGDTVELAGKGRHDPCVVPRAVPIVEAMTALVLADFLLLNRLSKI